MAEFDEAQRNLKKRSDKNSFTFMKPWVPSIPEVSPPHTQDRPSDDEIDE